MSAGLRLLLLFTLLTSIGGAAGVARAQATLHFNPSKADFGSVELGSSKTMKVSITNTGSTTAVIVDESLHANGYVMSGLKLPVSLSPGAHVVMSMEFKPTRTGLASGYALIESHKWGGHNASVSYSISGKGDAAAATGLEATPRKIDFEKVPLGTSVSQWIELKNTGTKTITIATVHGLVAGLTTTGMTLPLTLLEGKSKGFTLRFTPTKVGSDNETIRLENKSGAEELTLGVSGTAVHDTRILFASTDSLHFGDEAIGDSEKLAVTLKNTGNSDLTISDVDVTGIDVSVRRDLEGATMEAGQTATLELTFAPKKAERMSGRVKISSNADDSSVVIALSGSGVSPPQHSVALHWDASVSSHVWGYYVYRSLSPGGTYLRISSAPISGLKFTDGDVETGKTYTYAVTTVNSVGEESPYSEPVTAVIP